MTLADASPDPDRPRDPGLQNERTALAWMRTDLALLGVALIVARAVAARFLVLGLALAVVASVLAALVVRGARRRFAVSARSLAQDEVLPDGTLPGLVTALTALIGAAALAYVVGN